LVVAKAVTEGLQEAFGDEEERFVAVDGWFEVMLDLVVGGGAVELEKAVVLLVEDVVEAGEVGAEAFGESLAGKLGEVAEGLETPELENPGVGNRKGRGADEFVEREGVRVALAGGEGREMGEIGGGAEADLEREGEGPGGPEGVGNPVVV